MEPGQAALQKVVAAFGQDVLKADGTLNRKKLGEIVFGNPKKLEQLND